MDRWAARWQRDCGTRLRKNSQAEEVITPVALRDSLLLWPSGTLYSCGPSGLFTLVALRDSTTPVALRARVSCSHESLYK